MNDIRTLLHDSTTRMSAPTPSVVESDLARGRAALRRSNTRRGFGAGLVTLAAAGAVVLAVQTGMSGGGASPIAAPPAANVALGATLVSYTGTQPAGFIIDQVPEGWSVQDSKANQLLLAPDGLEDQDTNNYVDKIVIGLTNEATGVKPIEVTVGDVEVTIYGLLDDDVDGAAVLSDSKAVYVEQPSGTYVEAQIPDAGTWTNEQMATFAIGLHPTESAVVTVG